MQSMFKCLAIIAVLVAVVAVVTARWMYGVLPQLIYVQSPQEAAKIVVLKFRDNVDGVEWETTTNGSPSVQVLGKKDGETLYTVRMHRVLGLGWMEDHFEGKCDPDALKARKAERGEEKAQ